MLLKGFYSDVLEQEVAVLQQMHLIAAAAVAGAALLLWWRTRGPVPIYLLDFECYRPGWWPDVLPRQAATQSSPAAGAAIRLPGRGLPGT